ncbi:hypothetical protein ACKUS6_32010 [Klebsiella michiganensis]
MHRTAWRPVSVRLPPETAKKRPFAREISHFLPGILTTIIITSNVFCVYDNSVMPEELMTGSNNKTRDITSNRKYLIKNARGQAAYKGVVSENGIYGHSRFCNTDFDDKLACLNLSGV